ncbi:MAG: RecX family transcriptional regulator [Proteobacteria bacterium]|nr:RecX family transcriptional regulator [Pseudomonadota bacterium]MBU1584163.1 RecX family transcriptional regulator [Pseudomonadota bacterium]
MNLFPDSTKKFESLLNIAIKYLAYQPRTVYEMKKYLEKREFSENIAIKIIEILVDQKYLNDKDFTRLFLESRVKNKPKSKFALGYELKKKGISPSLIEAVLTPYDDQALALKAARPKIKLWQNLDDETFKKKMLNFLRYRGFSFDICISTLNQFIKSNSAMKEDKNEN